MHKAIEEVSPIFNLAIKHFILADSEEQEHTRTVVFAVFTSRFEFFGACHWTPVTQVWDILDLCGGEKGWVIYHNNLRLRHHKVSVHQGDFFACYERCDSTAPFQVDRPVTDIAQGWVANAPPISATTGLHHVHPTWAGTFVLAALVAMFLGINFVLLDSDCLPVTLFEVEDLWTEAFLARFPAHSDGGIPQAHPLSAFTRFRTDPQVVYTQHRVCSTRMGQGALVVTEPHAELNAGLIVIFRSSHPSLFDWNAWSLRFRSSPGSVTDEEFKNEASRLVVT